MPLYLAHRQRLLRTQHPAQNVAPVGADYVAIGLGVLLAVILAVHSLMNIPG